VHDISSAVGTIQFAIDVLREDLESQPALIKELESVAAIEKALLKITDLIETSRTK